MVRARVEVKAEGSGALDVDWTQKDVSATQTSG